MRPLVIALQAIPDLVSQKIANHGVMRRQPNPGIFYSVNGTRRSRRDDILVETTETSSS